MHPAEPFLCSPAEATAAAAAAAGTAQTGPAAKADEGGVDVSFEYAGRRGGRNVREREKDRD